MRSAWIYTKRLVKTETENAGTKALVCEEYYEGITKIRPASGSPKSGTLECSISVYNHLPPRLKPDDESTSLSGHESTVVASSWAQGGFWR
jgi:hypothetical protein